MNDVNMVDVSMDAEKPTVEDAIRWYQQEAWRTGALGFCRDFGDLKDVFEDWNIESTPALDVQPTAGNAMSLWAAAQRLGANAASVEMRHRRRMRTVDGDTLLQEDVRYEVHRRLQAAGMHLQEINANTQKMKSMTLMTAYLWDIEHRAPNSDSQIKAMVCTNFRGTKSPTPIVLSTKNPFPELLASLKEFVIARAEMTGRPIAAGEDIEFLNAWRYKMTDCKDGKLGFIDSGWTRLAYDFHYQTMLKRYSGPGQRAMIPLLAPVNAPPPEAPAPYGVVIGKRKRESSPDRSLDAQRGPSGVPIVANSAESSRTDSGEELLERVHWSSLTQRFMEGQDFQLFGDC